MTGTELNLLKSTELEILLIFDGYCKTHKLKYYLIGDDYLSDPPENKRNNPHSYISVKFSK